MFRKNIELKKEIIKLKLENEELKIRLSIKELLPTNTEIEKFASDKRKKDWSVELGHGATEYERGLVFGAKWIKDIVITNIVI